MSFKKSAVIWTIWFVFFSAFVCYIFIARAELIVSEWQPILAFLVLMLIASLFPLKIFNTPFLPIHGISLAIFLHFGLTVEAIIIQLGIFTMLIRVRVPKEEAFRYPLNSLIFLVTSFGAGCLFYLSGGSIPIQETSSLFDMALPISIYVISHFLINNYLVHILKKHLLSIKLPSFFSKALLAQALTAILVFPIGLILAISYISMGVISILLLGIPIITVSIILQLYSKSQNDALLLEKVSEFGHNINDTSTVEDILQLFSKNSSSIFPVEGLLVYEDENGEKLRRVPIPFDDREEMKLPIYKDSISQEAFTKKESLLFHFKKSWAHLDPYDELIQVQSILAVPIYRKHQVVGVITLTSSKMKAFNKTDLRLLEIMGNYMAVALQNHRQLEQTRKESIMCSLTKIYNFRYFESILQEQFDNRNSNQIYSMILIDIDHFKKINDSYGHYSGNKVLRDVAKVLEKIVGNKGILARYGGEEFVILLEEYNLKQSTDVANTLRKKLAEYSFLVTEDLSDGNEASINLTASIGVASKDHPDQSPLSVLRNADRAMYTGAKQKGRNKVAVFNTT